MVLLFGTAVPRITENLMEIGMRIISKKCAILNCGPPYANPCTTVWFQDSPIDFCDKAKYLGIQL